MSVTTCALSGQPLVNPVVSVKTGHVFEKELITKHLEATGQCPLTGIDLTAQDLVELSVSKAALPKPLVANNIPGILQMFQGEWDSLMLEVFHLRKSHEQTRRELSQALYQHDAACRVICRLMKEKEELQRMLALNQEKVEEYKSQLASQVDQRGNQGAGFIREEKEDEGIYKELVVRMEKLCDNLQVSRKEFKAPKEYPKADELKNIKEKARYPAHESTKPGILDIDIHPQRENFILSGGKDSKVVLLDHAQGTVVKKFEPFESKKRHIGISVARFVPGQQDLYGIFGATDGSAGLWSLDHANESYQERYAIKSHTAGINDVSFQPLNEYVAIASKDKTWSFHSLFQGVKLAQFTEEQEVNSIEFHPDGLMLIAGLKDGTIKIYDIRTHQEIWKKTDFKGDIGNISFSNKGLNFAAAWKNQDVARVFNLRKLDKEVFEIKHSSPVNSVNFDYYGGYLLTGAGSSLNIFASKHWNEPAVYTNEKAHDTGVVNVAKFAPSGKFIVSAGTEDRFMKVYGL